MADDKENTANSNEDLEVDENQEELSGTAGQASKDMQSMSVDPALLAGLDLGDSDVLTKAMQFVGAKLMDVRNTKTAREKEQQKVTISQEDVSLIVQEMEISKTAAEKALRENSGNLEQTLRALIAA